MSFIVMKLETKTLKVLCHRLAMYSKIHIPRITWVFWPQGRPIMAWKVRTYGSR